MSLFTPRRWPFWHHQLIRSQWRRWLLPTLLMLPYGASLIWLQSQGLIWLVQLCAGDGCDWSHHSCSPGWNIAPPLGSGSLLAAEARSRFDTLHPLPHGTLLR